MKVFLFGLVLFATCGTLWGKCSKEFVTKFMSKTNELRAKHRVGQLAPSESLDTNAQKWAQHLAKIGKMEHQEPNEFGENIWATSEPKDKLVNGSAPNDFWYDEISKYESYFGGEPDMSSKSEWTHFTQLVWKNTTEVGVGCAKTTKGTNWYVVAEYSPKGNIKGKFAKNVLPPKE